MQLADKSNKTFIFFTNEMASHNGSRAYFKSFTLEIFNVVFII